MIPQVLREVENNCILGNITKEEVKWAVFSMKSYKANGFPPSWEVTKKKLIWAT